MSNERDTLNTVGHNISMNKILKNYEICSFSFMLPSRVEIKNKLFSFFAGFGSRIQICIRVKS
jgi:hypothetical protein